MSQDFILDFGDVVKSLDSVFGFDLQHKEKIHSSMHIEMPGVKKDSIKVYLEEKYAKIKWRDRYNVIRQRSYYVGDIEDIDADYNDGLLKLNVKKNEKECLKEIKIKGV